jgi:hypothetical protein
MGKIYVIFPKFWMMGMHQREITTLKICKKHIIIEYEHMVYMATTIGDCLKYGKPSLEHIVNQTNTVGTNFIFL